MNDEEQDKREESFWTDWRFAWLFKRGNEGERVENERK